MPLQAIPTVESLRTATLRHRFSELFNAPGLTNHWGAVQAARDVTGLRSISFPPYGMGELGLPPYWPAVNAETAVLHLNGDYSAAAPAPVETEWQPDRIIRRQQHGDLVVTCETVVPFGERAVVQRIRVTNTGTQAHYAGISLVTRGGVTRRDDPWNLPQIPGEHDNSTSVSEGIITHTAAHSEAAVAQTTWPRGQTVSPDEIVHRLHLAPGESRVIDWALAVDAGAEPARRRCETLVRRVGDVSVRARIEWNAMLRDAFTPGNRRFSGHLPALETDDPDILRLYHTAVISLLTHLRTIPGATDERTYVTLGPRYWQTTTFLWDISLAAPLLAQLDPAVLRGLMERWMQMDIHQHFGTELLRGEPVGPWYSVNDYAMCRMAREYLRWTGDHAWLDTVISGKSVLEHIVDCATHWRDLDINGHGLADYGGVNNLLEAVASYVHEVAGMNAANVENLRFAAELLGARGEHRRAGELRREARRLLGRLQQLYVPGEGHWRVRLPDGHTDEVRHAYDFATVLSTVGADLPAQQRREMVGFFTRELQTPTWMRALSVRDHDVTFSVRPDHQWTGAYAAWPAICLNALYAAEEPGLALGWMRGLAQTARQGPIAQAYLDERIYDAEPGAGARKAPSDAPYINDWSCVSGAAFLEPIVAGLFGISAPLRGALRARPRFAGFDPGARLRNVAHQGRLYDVDARGAHLRPPLGLAA